MKIRSKIRTFTAFLLTAGLLLLCACNDAETPEQAIKRFNKKMNDCSYKAAFDYVKEYDGLSFDSGDRSGTRKIVDAVSKTLEIEIIDIQTSGANGSAVLNITTVDLREIYSIAASTVTNNYVDTVLKGSRVTAEEMREALVSEIVRESELSEAKHVTTECKINLTREKDKWYIILDSTSFNLMMGYINDANSMVESGDFTNVAPVSDSDAPAAVSSEEPEDSGSSVTFND
ncbi:MAG: hypothetical protein IJM51_05660 [Clostridia bacterium]|nr:hypothetical protein [Clostridia bacterium]